MGVVVALIRINANGVDLGLLNSKRRTRLYPDGDNFRTLAKRYYRWPPLVTANDIAKRRQKARVFTIFFPAYCRLGRIVEEGPPTELSKQFGLMRGGAVRRSG